MLIKNWMSRNVITVKPNDSVIKAQILLKDHNINRLPVIENGKLVGIITDRDIKQVLIPAETLLVKNMMTRKPVTVPLNFTVGETAEILLKHNISGVPVVDPQDNVMGVISKGDLFRVLIPLTGVGKKGIQFALRIANRPGSIKGITDIIRANGGRIMSVLTSYADTPQGSLKVYIRMYGFVRQKLNELKEKISEKAAIVYMIDHRENKREIYLNDEH